MSKRISLSALVLLILGCTTFLAAQDVMMHPPKVLTITREVLKTGKGPAHEKWEAGWPRMFAKADWPTHYLAMSALTGEPRVVFLSGYESMEAWAKDNDAQSKNATIAAQQPVLAEKDGDFLSGLTNAVLTYMPELSYHPEVPVAGTRYFVTVAVHVKRGHDDHFVQARKVALAGHEKGNLPDHFAIYHLVAGGNAGTYVIFLPIKSLAELDNFANVHGKGYKDALGEEGQKALDDFDREGVESQETHIFALSPSMSYPAKEWIQADPDFWTPKAAMAAKPAAKKDTKKDDAKQ